MSQVYTLEPPTQGKVILRTTLGDLDIELWAKEAPKAVRNFVQLCTEGYYDGTVFHRVIKDFMFQGKVVTQRAQAMAASPFMGNHLSELEVYVWDEFHSRLKFNHRGVVACANQNKPDTNGSQFFITFDRADHCNKQYTIIGKVTGDTLYNLSRFNELEVDDDDRPAYPPLLTRADVLWNPFDDLKPRVDRDGREAAAKAAKEAVAADAKKGSRKQAKNFSLMSFGEEAEEEDQEAAEAAAKLKIKSAHDALEDERLAKEPVVDIDLQRVRDAMRAAKAAQQDEDATGDGQPADGNAPGGDFGSRMLQQLQAKRKAIGVVPQAAGGTGAPAQQEQPGIRGEEPELDYGEEGEEAEDVDGEGEEAAPRKRARLADMGRGRKSSAAVVPTGRQIKVADSELLTDWERKRQEYKQRKRLGGGREKETLQRLAQFGQELKAATTQAAPAEQQQQQKEQQAAEQQNGQQPALAKEGDAGYDGKVREDIDHRAYMPAAWRIDDYLDGGDEDEDLDLSSLRQHKLSFAKDRKDAMSRSDNTDDYVVFDPLLEAGKAKFNKQQAKHKKQQTEWGAGRGPGTGQGRGRG
ncbi:Peptidyl-prolyl cis-trans isomerase CYP57 [Chlorella vulgaris]